MTIAEYIAQRLHENGIRYVFGIPGGPSIPYMESFRTAGIEFILVSNEASAAIMADVTARLSGVPGVCHATFGPGATNISTGVGEALLDRSPVLVFTSEMSDAMISRVTQMNISHQKLFEPVTKATFRVSGQNVSEVMNEALRICREEYPGPVHIGLPVGIADLEMKDFLDDQKSTTVTNFHNETGDIIFMLEGSRRPLLALGLTAARLHLGKSILALLEDYPMPVVITPMAKGLISEDHPCYAGVLFHSLSDYLEDIYEKTDLIIGLGYDPVEFDYESWTGGLPLIHFDVRPSDHRNGVVTAEYAGEPDDWFRLIRHLNRGSMVFEGELIRGVRNEMEAVFNGFTNHFGPAATIKILQEELPENLTITADVGSHLHVMGQFWRTGGKTHLLMTNGWSGMGFGLPAALAAQLYSPESTVVCITGDGGFLMMAGEIITARRYNLPVIIVVFSDGELNLIKVKQSWRDLPPYATILYQGDLFDSSRFLGVRVLKAFSNETMRSAVIEAMSVSEPVIINAIIDPEDYKWLIVKR